MCPGAGPPILPGHPGRLLVCVFSGLPIETLLGFSGDGGVCQFLLLTFAHASPYLQQPTPPPTFPESYQVFKAPLKAGCCKAFTVARALPAPVFDHWKHMHCIF